MLETDEICTIRNVLAIALLLGLLSFAPAAQAQVDSTLIRIRAATVDSVVADFPLYFSTGYQERATSLSALLRGIDGYLRDSLGVHADLSLAVLAEPEWNQIWPFPYGVPYVSLGAPWVVVMPAALERSVMYASFSQALGDEGAQTMIDNIGFHEVGHVYITEYLYPDGGSATPPLRWFDEFLAQYLAYAFLHELARDRVQVWDAFTEGMLAEPTPRYTSLTDFEDEYYGYLGTPEGTSNYGWYQSTFAKRAAEVYERRGLGFLATLKEHLPWDQFEEWTTEAILVALEAIEPGFKAWAEQLEE